MKSFRYFTEYVNASTPAFAVGGASTGPGMGQYSPVADLSPETDFNTTKTISTKKKKKKKTDEERMKSFKQIRIPEAKLSKYIVKQNPSNKLWYALGHVGRNQWMPVSDGFKDKSKAQKWAQSQSKVDKSAGKEVGGV